MDKILENIISEAAKRKVSDEEAFLSLVKENMKGQNKHKFPSNIILRKAYFSMVHDGKIKSSKTIEKLLVTKKMRSLSGVSIITVLTKPWPCPGKCLYCPTEADVPKSYLSSEPAVMRAILCGYDPYKQVKARLESLELEGHPTDKIELIIIGGTFSYLPRDYQEWFVTQCLKALNDQFPMTSDQPNSKNQISNESASNVIPAQAGIQKKSHVDSRLRGNDKVGGCADALSEAKEINEKSKHRCVGLTLETRPDYITKGEVQWMRYLGATRVELGVQSVFDDILETNKRGHKVSATVRATKLLKDAGFKICYHMMPGLQGSDPCKDLKMFKIIFTDARFQPDYVKIYPCVVTKGSELYDLWKSGKYAPYTDEELENLICEIKKFVPYHVRIMRLIRDIPSSEIEAGSKISNMRQNVQRKLQSEGASCKCIRCREIGLTQVKSEKSKVKSFSSVIPASPAGRPSDFIERRVERSLSQNDQFPISNIQSIPNVQKSSGTDSGQARMTLFRDEYKASGGTEYFLSYESPDRKILFALLRLRFPAETFLPELKDSAIIREVHTYGQQIKIGKKPACRPGWGDTQHKGLGKKLIKEAEKMAKESGYKKIAIISGVGVRDYYRKLGYELEDEYMVKDIG